MRSQFRRVGGKKSDILAKRYSFLFYPVRDLMLVENRCFRGHKRTVRYAIFPGILRYGKTLNPSESPSPTPPKGNGTKITNKNLCLPLYNLFLFHRESQRKLFPWVHFILSQKKSRRDYRPVEKNRTTIRMPSGMHPVYGCIPAACRKKDNRNFLPSDTFLTECFSESFNTKFSDITPKGEKVPFRDLGVKNSL